MRLSMAKHRESSFRRTLVSRIVLLFIPVLWIGQILALNKARTSLVENARHNLTENSILKGDKIVNSITALKNNLHLASKTRVIESGSPSEIQEFLTTLQKQLPELTNCLQLSNFETGYIIASTCSHKTLPLPKFPFLSDSVQVETILPKNIGFIHKRDTRNQLELLLSSPVYKDSGKLSSVLTLKSILQPEIAHNGQRLAGYTIIIAQDGTILAHQSANRVGTNIEQHPDAERLRVILKNALAGQEDTVNLYFKDGNELVAGYTAITNPITNEPNQKWVVLVVTPLDNALLGLGQIKLILFLFTVGLVVISVFASLYLSRDLALPVEKLRDYALNLHLNDSTQPVPQEFKIRELNQLAQAIEQMVERLKAWAEELESAWQDAKNANQVKSQFLATTSHELRNPLNIIINCIRVVREDLCDNREEEIEFLQRADDTAIHLLRIINDLLDISKIEAGKLAVIQEPLNLAEVLKEVINLQSVNVFTKGLQLKCDISKEVIPVFADAVKFKQVLINIIGNATKFTQCGSITISTEFYEDGDNKSVVAVAVQDTGIGIDPNQQDKLFRPFVMVDGSNMRQFGGTGLGLAISRNLIELMGGSISLQSAGINQGTRVTITLPLIDAGLLPIVEGEQESVSPPLFSNKDDYVYPEIPNFPNENSPDVRICRPG
jgi:two-component system, NarL family, sensor histidine kinase BarA